MPQYASDTIDDVHLALRGLSHRWAANGMPGSTSTSMCGGIGHVSTSPSGLLVVTFRPEFNAPWVGRPHVTSLTLNWLGERDAATIIERLVANKGLPADVMAEIVERRDGIPLFVEEMTKAVLEAESEGEARRMAAAVSSPALAVPASLHASLMAGLDRLSPAKEVAHIGAAVGREFSHALLPAVVRKPEAISLAMRGNGPLMAEGMIRAWLNGSRAGCDARPGVNNAVLRGPQFVHRPAIYQRISLRDVEGEIVARLPDGSYRRSRRRGRAAYRLHHRGRTRLGHRRPSSRPWK